MNEISAAKKSRSMGGSVRIVLLVLGSFFLGIAVTVFWFHHTASDRGGTGNPETAALTQAPEPVGVPAPAPVATPPAANPQPTDPALVDQVKKAVPNYASISLEDGEQILREAALKEFADVTTKTDAQMKAAQQQLQDAQNNGSAADQQTAMKHVQDTQAAATEKLKQIGANLQDQIAALKGLKSPQ